MTNLGFFRCLMGIFFVTVISQLSGNAIASAEIVLLIGQGERKDVEPTTWVSAQVKDHIKAGGFVRTLANSQMALVLADRSQIRLNQNSQMQIKSVAEAGEWSVSTVRLNSGRAWSQARPLTAPPVQREAPRVSMETPSVTLSIRGTDWEVEVFPDGSSQLVVLSGVVSMANAYGTLVVRRGEAARAAVGQAPVRLQLINPRQRVQWVSVWSPSSRILAGDRAKYFEEAIRLSEAGDFSRALSSLPGVAAIDPVADLLAADLLAGQGEYVQSEQRLKLGVEDASMSDPARVCLLAHLWARSDRLSEARRLLRLALVGRSENIDLMLCSGDLAIIDGDLREAWANFEKVLLIEPDRADAWFRLGQISTEREDVAAARQSLLKARSSPSLARLVAGELGTLETFAGNLALGREYISRQLEINASDYVALTAYGINALKAGLAKQALEAFLKAGAIEPRYARAWMYSGIAFYQLGEGQRAREALQRSAALDTHDPLPHLLMSLIASDALDYGVAIEAAGEAQARLPYLKSMNQLANDQKGSVSLGGALAYFGMEDWARNYAYGGYSAFTASSHLFLADRLPGAFGRNAELMQGFLVDPTSFGASNRHSQLIATPGHYGRFETYFERADWRQTALIGSANGLFVEPLPVAYAFSADIASANSRQDASNGSSGNIVAGLGARFNHVFGGFVFASRYALDSNLAQEKFPDNPLHIDDTRADIGFHLRPGADSQFWFKAGNGRRVDQMSGKYRFDAGALGSLGSALGVGGGSTTLPLDLYRAEIQQHDFQLRHSIATERWVVSSGFETSNRLQAVRSIFDLGPYRIESVQERQLKSRDAFVEAAWRNDRSMAIDLALFWQQAEVNLDESSSLGFVHHSVQPTQLFANNRTLSRDYLNPRVGLKWSPDGANAIRVVGQRWLRPASASTLSPVSTSGIAIDDRLVTSGGLYERARVQLEHESPGSLYAEVFFDYERVNNEVLGQAGSVAELDVGQLDLLRTRQEFFNPRSELERTPAFLAGKIMTLGLSGNILVTPRHAMAVRYLHREQWQTGSTSGKIIPYLPTHTLAVESHWTLPQRWLLGMSAIYRSSRFRDSLNLDRLSPGWNLGVTTYWESSDKRNSIQGILDNLGGRKSSRDQESTRLILRYTFKF